ncbi:MAG: U32 family peptidase [Candidatus Brocadiaceae bacterium]
MNNDANYIQPITVRQPFKRNKPELLSPAGNMACFFAAIEHGADAVYFGLKNFSARAGAQNLTLDDASKAIAYARQSSVKVYVTLNTLIKTHELENVVDYLIALEELQPDAIIIQDLGLLYLLQTQFPHFNLHASTQMVIHNLAGVRQLEKMGFQRVVLARELSIEEIGQIRRNTSLEIEVFIHGALCYSYSGLCFFSSMLGGRSGNRGRCAQPCRMPYKTSQNNEGYLFSMKDLMTLPSLDELTRTGIHSFKIEGRMKSPEYVAVVTNTYRQAIDGKLVDLDEAIHRIKTVFSRETTHSYLLKENDNQYRQDTQCPPCELAAKSGGIKGGGKTYHQKGYLPSDAIKASDMINPRYPAHIGSYAGVVVRAEKGRIVIKADTEIGVRDLLQVFDHSRKEPTLLPVKDITVKGKRVFSLQSGDIATLESDKFFRPGAKLYLLYCQKTNEIFTPKIPKKLMQSKIPVQLEITIMVDTITIKGIAQQVSYARDYPVKLEKGVRKVINEASIKGCFSRLGETPFELADLCVTISEDLFVPLSVLNEIRRDYFQNLTDAWKKAREQQCGNIKQWLKGYVVNKTDNGGHIGGIGDDREIRLSLKIERLSYLEHASLENMYKLYILLTRENLQDIEQNSDIVGTLSNLKDKVVFSVPTIIREKHDGFLNYERYKERIHTLMSQGFNQFQLSNLGALGLFDSKDVALYADYPLYCINPLSAVKLRELGFSRHTLSPEDDRDNLRTLCVPDADVIVYQDTLLFTSETCIWANMKRMCPGKSLCGFGQTVIENERGDRFMAINDECKTVVFNEKPFSLIHFIPDLIEDGHRSFRIDLCYKDYTPEMIQNIFSQFQKRNKVKDSMIGNFERGLL